MIKRSIVKAVLDMIRFAARGLMLITLTLLALWLCWFTFEFLTHLKEWCSHKIFVPWY